MPTRYNQIPPHRYRSPRSAFRGKSGGYYHLDDIRRHLQRHHPAMLGRHVREQIEALGLVDEFEGGTVLIQLPYTFA